MKLVSFGNEMIEDDRLAVEIGKELSEEGFDFTHCHDPAELMDLEEDVTILDVVEGIHDVVFISDIEQLKANRLYSLHDFDLGFFLKLMGNAKLISTVSIIGIPQHGNKEEIKKKVREKILALQKKMR